MSNLKYDVEKRISEAVKSLGLCKTWEILDLYNTRCVTNIELLIENASDNELVNLNYHLENEIVSLKSKINKVYSCIQGHRASCGESETLSILHAFGYQYFHLNSTKFLKDFIADLSNDQREGLLQCLTHETENDKTGDSWVVSKVLENAHNSQQVNPNQAMIDRDGVPVEKGGAHPDMQFIGADWAAGVEEELNAHEHIPAFSKNSTLYVGILGIFNR